MIPTGYAEVTLEWGGVALPNNAATVFGVTLDTFPTPDSPEDIGLAVLDALDTADFITNMTSLITLPNIHVKVGPDATGPSGDVATGAAGAAGAACGYAGASVLIKKGTALGGRKGRGRMYIPHPLETDWEIGGVLTSTALANWQAAASEFATALVANQCAMVVLHNDATTPSIVTSLVVSNSAATQRRRQRR